MAKRDEIKAALIAGDVDLLWRMWRTWFPTAPQPATWQEAEIQLHAARTAAQSVPLRLRCWSHHWLVERKLESLLPPDLRPKAEQYRPRVASSVGFAWGTTSRILKHARPMVMSAVHNRIEEMAADGLLETDPDGVRHEIMLTKNRTLYGLFGNIASLQKEGKNVRA